MAKNARSKVEPKKYEITDLDGAAKKRVGTRRSTVVAPIDVQGKGFVGVLAINEKRAAPADSLEDAPAPSTDEKKKPGKKDAATEKPTRTRTMNPNYDHGYQKAAMNMEMMSTMPSSGGEFGPTMAAPPPVKQGKPNPRLYQLAAVTAVVPHEKLTENYKTEFELAPGYHPERDAPNYLGYEVQRVDVTGAPQREVDEKEWQDVKDCSTADQMKWRETWVGVCEEIVDPQYLVDKVSYDANSAYSHQRLPRSSSSPIGRTNQE